MATGNPAYPSSGHTPQNMHDSHSAAPNAASPPTKRDLKSWWTKFSKNSAKKEVEQEPTSGIFGVPLAVSIKYANVAISLTDADGKSFIYGYVPIVVAKCGVFLKEKATDIEGIFRLSGSEKRIKDLRGHFDSPDRYGKGLDWTGFTVHDAANILRRYLNQLPEPIIPLQFYDRFRDPLRNHQAQAVGNVDAQVDDVGGFDEDGAIIIYQQLITELPALNRQLLLYILDLLAVFASKSDLNRMTSANLAAIFQPGLLSHPNHDMSPPEYRLSQDVLIFLIENQDHFLIGMKGTAADEKTVQEVQAGPNPKTTINRSSSNASAGAESVRKYGGVRRNVSVSSKHSRSSSNIPSPATPSSGAAFPNGSNGGGLQRSNTVPSKKSPALTSARFNKPSEPPTPSTLGGAGTTPALQSPSPGVRMVPSSNDKSASVPSAAQHGPEGNPVYLSPGASGITHGRGQEKLLGDAPPGARTPTSERNLVNFFSKSTLGDGEGGESRQPNKLRKKKIPGSQNQSAQSSMNSLNAPNSIPTESPLSKAVERSTHSDSRYSSEAPPAFGDVRQENSQQTSKMLRPKSPTGSAHSRSSVTDVSDLDDPAAKAEKREKSRRWRLPSRSDKHQDGRLGANPGAHGSKSSIGSSGKARKSFNDSQRPDPQQFGYGAYRQASIESPPKDSSEKKQGPIEWFRKRFSESKEVREERKVEKERGKSPPPAGGDRNISKQSLSMVAEMGEGSTARPPNPDSPPLAPK